jgi:outer membrane protein, multidrug efflux system
VLLARPPAALLHELATTQPLPITPPAVPVGLPSDLLRRRPDGSSPAIVADSFEN